MSNDPYPSERPDPGASDPYGADPYSSDPYVPSGSSSEPNRPPAYEPGRSAPLPAPLPPGAMQTGPAQPGPGMPPPYPYAPPTPPNTSAIVLVIISSLALVTGYCCYIGIPGLVLGILGITKQSSDPEGAARLTKIGWITVAVLTALTVVAVGLVILLAVPSES